MIFPISVQSVIQSHNGQITRTFQLNGGLSTILGPNGSGKTHILRGLKATLNSAANGKKIRFISAGRMGILEQYRSDYDGHRSSTPRYDDAMYGSKSDTVRRHQYETLEGDFQTLAERIDIQIKVQERLRKLFKRNLIVEWNAGQLKILFNRTDEASVPYSSGREASGLMHLAGLLSALYDDEVGVLLIDEPEVSLHPQLQAFLLREMRAVAGSPGPESHNKIIVIATHSTEMIHLTSVQDLPNFIFAGDLSLEPAQISPDAPELLNKSLSTLVARFGQTHRLTLFSRRPLMVEGASDLIICQALAQKLALYPEAAGSQFLPVEGKGQMPTLAKLFRLMGKEPTALADLDAFADGPKLVQDYLALTPAVSESEAATLGAASGSDLARRTHEALCTLVDNRWNEVQEIAKQHFYYDPDNQEDAFNRRRAALGAVMSSSPSALLELPNGGVDWINLRTRVQALFGMAERCGLFFARKGTIESYFFTEIAEADFDKPAAATEESERILASDTADVLLQYDDILRCIKYASNAEVINEAEALQDLLLAVAAPAQAHVKARRSSTELNSLARQTLGEKAKLFDLSAEGSKLVIGMESAILDVASRFPVTIEADGNVLAEVSRQLGLD